MKFKFGAAFQKIVTILNGFLLTFKGKYEHWISVSS